MNDQESLETVFRYHEQTKHHLENHARSLGYLDWSCQPNPFRSYQDTKQLRLDQIVLDQNENSLSPFRQIPKTNTPLNRRFVSQLFYDSMALSAWKSHGQAQWSLRCNPSSGNLHPTESYLVAGPIPGLTQEAGLFHYAPLTHALEMRAQINQESWNQIQQCFAQPIVLIGLCSIYWRESWKYGERAFRYCQLDVGHAMAAIAVASGVQGWHCQLSTNILDEQLRSLFGVGNQEGPEAEHPDCLLVLSPEPLTQGFDYQPNAVLLDNIRQTLSGKPNQLSPRHHRWPIINKVAQATRKCKSNETKHPIRQVNVTQSAHRPLSTNDSGFGHKLLERKVVHQRRSAVAMDGSSSLNKTVFFDLLRTLIPRNNYPWHMIDQGAIQLVFFIHRIGGLAPGTYLLLRDENQKKPLQTALDATFRWQPIDEAKDISFYLLKEQNVTQLAEDICCHQSIASEGVFAVGMLAPFQKWLMEKGPWNYLQLHWEAGLVGQMLYLLAETVSLRGTGIGCFYDDLFHTWLGLENTDYQTLYHFTVGKSLEDPRLQTREPYFHLTHQT